MDTVRHVKAFYKTLLLLTDIFVLKLRKHLD